MLLHVTFIYCISAVAANYDLFNTFLNGLTIIKENQIVFRRYPRQSPKNDDFEVTSITCEQLWHTSRSPFVCILLYKSSGRFLGMGSIIDKRTILTASKVVENTLHSPQDVLVLGGRLSPWWGKNSQVKKASDIQINDVGLAVVKLKEAFSFNKNVAPIKLTMEDVANLPAEYEAHFAVFGVPRSSWDAPGDAVPKSSIYLTKIESLLLDKKVLDPCKKAFPDRDFNESFNLCTSANGTYCWGCIGSPTVAVNKANKVLQIGVLTKTTLTETDTYHIHTKLSPFETWLRSHSLINFDVKK